MSPDAQAIQRLRERLQQIALKTFFARMDGDRDTAQQSAREMMDVIDEIAATRERADGR